MGFIRDTIFLRRYVRAKAISNFIDELDEATDKPKKGHKAKRVQKEKNSKRHLGFWDFLDKQIQDEKKEAKENPTSWKEVLKVVGLLLLFSFGFYLLSKLLGLFEHWWNTVVTPL